MTKIAKIQYQYFFFKGDSTLSNEFHFLSSDDHTTIYAKKWCPTQPPIGIIHIIHGMAEHINRYDEYAQHLVQQGWLVVGDDHLGHGHSSPTELGYFGEHPVLHLLDDEVQLFHQVKAQYPQLPYVLLGHSMGSMMAQALLPRLSNQLAGCILTGTTAPHPELIPVWPLVVSLSKTAGHQTGTFFDRLAFGSFSKRFNRHVKYSWLTHDSKIIDSYNRDPWSGFIFTYNGFYALFTLTKMATTADWYHGIRRDLPLLLASGTHDPVGKFGRGPKRLFDQLTHDHFTAVTLHLFDQMRHEILNETDRSTVYDFIDQWLHKNVKII